MISTDPGANKNSFNDWHQVQDILSFVMGREDHRTAVVETYESLDCCTPACLWQRA